MRLSKPTLFSLILGLVLVSVPDVQAQSELDQCIAALDRTRGRVTSALERMPACGKQSDEAQPLAKLVLYFLRNELGFTSDKLNSCNSLELAEVKGNRIILVGKMTREDGVVKVLEAIKQHVPDVTLDVTGLKVEAICGRRMGEYVMIEEPFQVARAQVAASRFQQLPRGEDCERIGQLVDADPQSSSALAKFWVQRVGATDSPVLDLCERNQSGAWRYRDYNLFAVQASVLLRANK